MKGQNRELRAENVFTLTTLASAAVLTPANQSFLSFFSISILLGLEFGQLDFYTRNKSHFT
jgi:hypothetical protein